MENLTAASLDAQSALAFVAVVDGDVSIADDGTAGTPPPISPTATAVQRIVTAPDMAYPANDDHLSGSQVKPLSALVENGGAQ